MSKSQNIKNEQQKDLCITSEQLTEQWKKGELPEGDYFISNGDEIYPDYYDSAEGFLKTYDYGVRKVLAEVPDYVEYKQLKEYEHIVTSYSMKPIDYDIACETVNKLLDERKAKIEENAQLKEQINKCCLDAINRGTANAVKAVKEFGMPERIKELVEENTQLKELLKECELWFTGVVGNMNDKNVGEHNKSVPIGNFEHIFKEFSRKIKGVLK